MGVLVHWSGKRRAWVPVQFCCSDLGQIPYLLSLSSIIYMVDLQDRISDVNSGNPLPADILKCY